MRNTAIQMKDESPLMLERCEAFAGLKASIVQALEERSERTYVPRGEVVLSAESPTAHDVFVILKGTVVVYRKSRAGHQVELGKLSAGQLFGELGAIDGRHGSATVQAIEDAELARIPLEHFRALLESNTQFALHITKRIVQLLRSLDERVVSAEGFHGLMKDEYKKLLISTL